MMTNLLSSSVARLRFLLMMLVMMFATTNAWGATYTLDQTSLTTSKSAYQTSDYTHTATDESKWVLNGYGIITTSPKHIQLGKASKNYIKTPTCSGNITKVSITFAKACSYYVAIWDMDGNKASSTVANKPAANSTTTFTISGEHKQLQVIATRTTDGTSITSSNAAAYISSITITYETAASYTVTYNANGGSGTMSNSTGSSIKIKECTFTAPECKQFTSWNTAANGSGTSYAPNATVATNLTLYAQWENLPSYTVKLMDNNEVLTSSCNTPISLPDRNCDGYTFVGWTKTWTEEQEEWTTTAPDIIEAGSYTPTANESLYPVYTKTEGGGSEPTAYSAGDVGSFIIASNVGNKWYAIPENPTLSSNKITGVEITVSQTAGGVNYVSTANAEGYTWTIADATNGQTISDGSKYIYHSNGGASGTNLTYGNSTSYTWKIEKENNGLTFKGMNGSTTNSRGLLFNGSVFGGYALSNEDASGYYRIQVLPIGGGSTTYYISVPDCTTETSVTLNPNGGTFASTPGDWTKEGDKLTKEVGGSVTLPTPTHDGCYDFAGWYDAQTDGNKIDADAYTPTEDVELFAHWTESTISFIAMIDDENIPTVEGVTIEIGLNEDETDKVSDGVETICGNNVYLFRTLVQGYKEVQWTVTIDGTQETIAVQNDGEVPYFVMPKADVFVSAELIECDEMDAPIVTATSTNNSITLSWDPIIGAKEYNVFIFYDYGNSHQQDDADVVIDGTNYTFTNLDAEHTYTYIVQAQAEIGTCFTEAMGEIVTASATCTVTYDANGGTGIITDATEYTNGAKVTVKGNFGIFTKDGYAFTGWNTKADGTGDAYKHGNQFTITSNTTLYAQWCKAYWKLVTNDSELENDTRIVIAAKDDNFALSTTQNTNNRGQAEITKTYNTITFRNGVQILNLLDATEDKYWLRDIDEPMTGYLYAAGTNSNNYLKTGVDNSASGNDKWSITITEGLAYISANGTNENNQLKYNTSSNLFSCYGVGNKQKDVVIYKEVCVQDQYNVNEPKLTNATAANDNPKTVAADATSLTLNYSADAGYLLPETITVKMGGALLVARTDYTWDKATGTLTINVTGFYGDIDVKIVAEADPCYGFAMSEVTATSTTNSITLSWTAVEGATSYNVTLNPGDFSVSTGKNSHTFEGLSPKTEYTWEVQAVKGTCQASQTGSITTQKETFTVSWIVNGNTESPYATESVVDGNKITTYPNDPSAPSGCREKVFVGWTDNPINTPTNETPATLYKQKSDIPEITETTTLHAVWADVIGGGETTKSLLNDEIKSFHKQGTTTSYSDLTVPSTDGDWSGLFCTANSNSVYTINLKKELVNENRPYLKSSECNNITKVSVVATHASNKGNRTLYLCNDATDSPESNNIGTISVAKDNNSSQLCTLSSSATTLYLYVDNGIQIKTITLTTGGTTITAYTTLCDECTPSESLVLAANASTADLDINGKATITFSTTGGNGGAITYAANPKTGVTWDNGTATFTKAGDYTITASQEKNGENCPTTSNTVNVTITAIPHLYFVTEPADPIEFDPVECGGNTALTNKKSVELQGYNLTGNVTATVTGAYKIARTSSATLGEYSNSLTLDKTDAGKINGNYDIVYILSFPPAGGTASTEGELTFTTEAGNTLTVNLSTPTVTCTPRTLTFNDRGNTTTQKYYAGAEVPQPEDPTGVCTIPVNYVFDGWAEAKVTDGSTSYTKVNFPYSMPAKNTTLYAVYRYTEENANSDKFMSVDKELGELVSGMDYVLTGYYGNNNDGQEYALSITAYETGKYKTKFVDVQESSILYEEDIPYYEFTTTDNEIIWTIEGDEANGYTFQNKSNNKYLAVSADKLTLSDNAAKFTIEHETGVDNNGEEVYYMSLLIKPVSSTKYLSSYYKDATAGVLFNLHTASTLSLYLYKRVASNLYTTSPACGPMLEITSGKDIYVTSGYGTGRNTVIAQQTVEYRATRLSTNNAGIVPDVKVTANGVTMGGVVTNNLKVVGLTQNKELIGDKYTITGTVTVQYTPTANDLQEDIQVQLAVDYNTDAKDNFTVHARSLPSAFVIVAKQGDKWYALNADMSGRDAEKANGYLQVDDIEDPTKATFAPCNTIYTFDGMVDGGNKEYMRFQGIDGKYLWAASAGNTGIQNYAKNTPAAGTIAYNWQLYTNDNETYQLQNEGNGRKLGLSKDLNYGMYSYVSTLQQDIRILPYVEKCIYNYAPTNLKVSVLKRTYVTLTWDAVAGATKYQYSTDATNWNDAGTEPTVTINNLTGDTEYTYYIRAYHEDAGVSQECIDYAEITFTTANCDDVPTDITYTADLTSITVTWTAVSTNCVVKLYSDEACTSVVKFADELNGSVTFSQLGRNTTYYVQILADGTCASPIIPVKTEDVEVDIVEWQPQGIIVDINTDETIGVTLENEVSYGSNVGAEATELFFSKYYEASYNVKLVAIYNGTKNIIDLTDYIIKYGKTSWESNYITLKDFGATKGQIQPGEEIILYSYTENNADDKKILDCVHEAFPDGNWVRVTNNNNTGKGILAFGGDKTLALFKGTDIIDIIGAVNGSIPNNSKANNQPSWGDANGWICDEGLSLADDSEIGISTNRCLLVRNNTVTSGANAVANNTIDFVTLCSEWKGAHVLDSDIDNGIQESCENFAYVGTFDYSDYYTKYETMGDKQVFDEKQRNEDGTVNVEIPNLDKQSCRNIRVKLTNSNGEVLSNREYKVPIMITTTQGTDGQAFLALQENLATVEVDGNGNPTGNKTNLTLDEVREICKTCDVVIRDNATLMKMADDAANDHPEVHDIYVYENSSLIVPNGTNYTINNLSLRRKEDAVASVSAYPDALKLPESAAAPISLDFRLSAESWHWFTLPYDCNISEVTWVDGSPAQYNVDWFLMTYDGEKRADTQAGGCWKAHTGTTIKAGEGFILAINGNINNPAHTYELRFPMSKEVLAAEGTDKTVDVRAWGVETDIRPNHKGWNLIGNPYLAYYQRDNITKFEGLRLGQLTGPDPQTGYWEQTGEVPYIVVPVGAGWVAYEQVLASDIDLLPFTAYFVQVGKDGTHNSDQDLKVSFDHTKLQLSATPMPASIIQRSATEDEEPIIVGVSLTNAKGESDKTSLIIDDQYTDEYEMHADFFKWFGDYYTYYTKPVLYTVGADQGKRAFNALNEELATQPVALGMYAAQAGEYTFTLDLRSDLSHVEEIWLHDATENIYTNLLQDSYTFSTGKINGEGRFFLSVKMKPQQEPDPDPEPTPDPTPDSDPETSLDDIVANRVFATVKDNVIYISGLLSDAQLWIYDAAGRLMHYDQTKYYQHTYLVPQGGAYFVRVQGTMQTQTIKVVVK